MAAPEIDLPRTSCDDESGNSPDIGGGEQEKKSSSSHSTPSTQSAIDIQDAVTWHYLSWGTQLPQPAFSTSKELSPTDRPSTTGYEKYTNPFEWSEARKNFTTWLSCAATVFTAYAAGSYTAGDEQMESYWDVSHVAITIGVTSFTCGFAIAPMVLAPFSEINGRRPVFVITGVLYVVLQICCAVTRSFGGMIVARFIKGCVSSTFSTMVGGVVSDIYRSEDRNTAMALFSGAALFGTGLGPMISGFFAAHTTWRWIFYFQAIVDGVLMVLIAFFFRETRGSVLLSKKAVALNKYYDLLETAGVVGVHHVDPATPGGTSIQRIRWKVKSDEDRVSIAKMISVSLYRPFHLLFTEPVVFFFSLWITFSWSILYLNFGAIPLVFENHYGFNLQESGAVFAALMVAAIISTIISILGEKIMKRKRPDMAKTPEGRLWFACFQSILLPIGLFWFGWTSFPSIPWIVPVLGIGCATMGIFSIYLAVFNYLADTYHRYASSALAAQSFCRNMVGGAFPLVVNQMYSAMTYQGASSLLGGLGVVLTIVPFVLAIWGPKIRARSKIASEILASD